MDYKDNNDVSGKWKRMRARSNSMPWIVHSHDRERDRVPLKKRRVSIDLTLLSVSTELNVKATTSTTGAPTPSSSNTQGQVQVQAQCQASSLPPIQPRPQPQPQFKVDPNAAYTKKHPQTLALPSDKNNVNTLHAFVRSSLLELFVLKYSNNMSGCHFPGRVGLRCVHCKHLPKEEQATGAVFYPKSLKSLYRNVCTWQRVHFKDCKCVPDKDKGLYKKFKEEDKTRGRTKYWETSAGILGLVNVVGVHGRGGIIFTP